MRSITRIAAAGLSLLIVPLGIQRTLSADELFSENRLDRVFAQPGQTAPAQPEANQQPGVAPQGKTVKIDELEAFIRAAGFEPKKVADNVFAIEIPQGQFRFPVGFTISPNGENLWVGTLLNSVDENTVSPKVLLALLKANGTYGPAHFIYSPEGKRIDLNRGLLNVNLQPADLKRAVDDLIEVAVKTSDIWMNPTGTPAQPGQPTAPTQPATPPQTSTPPTAPVAPVQPPTAPVEPAKEKASPSEPVQPTQQPTKAEAEEPTPSADENKIVGNWVSGPQKNGVFVLQFAADGTYELNFRNVKGKENKTRGKFTLTADSLKLVGSDGKTLEGKFIRVNANTFVFMPSTSGAKITFVRQ